MLPLRSHSKKERNELIGQQSTFIETIQIIFRITQTVLISFSIHGCSQPPPACPHDNIQAPAASAGCMIISGGRLLVVKDFRNRISVPGGSSDQRESPRCTAHRETWEETGFDTSVGELVETFNTGFHLYHCSLSHPNGAIEPPARFELKDIFWLSSKHFSDHNWRYPYQENLFSRWMVENPSNSKHDEIPTTN
ncbi:MAG: 8-oxo-dGTP diphosphatase [Oceanicoccus sp.]|jgi:8-oxo-dGTP diphosphatase